MHKTLLQAIHNLELWDKKIDNGDLSVTKKLFFGSVVIQSAILKDDAPVQHNVRNKYNDAGARHGESLVERTIPQHSNILVSDPHSPGLRV